jgi:hypothetical protein
MEGLYEHSQIITNTASATYENRLRIVDKSSEAAGTYTCEVTNPRGSVNGSLYIQGNEHKVAVLMQQYYYDDNFYQLIGLSLSLFKISKFR